MALCQRLYLRGVMLLASKGDFSRIISMTGRFVGLMKRTCKVSENSVEVKVCILARFLNTGAPEDSMLMIE